MDETSPAQEYEEIGRSLQEFCDSCWRERDGDVVAHSEQQDSLGSHLLELAWRMSKAGPCQDSMKCEVV